MTNPFSSDSFNKIWLKHFNQGKLAFKFDFLKGPSFVKTGFLKYYVNVGKNLTKGVYFEINPDASDFKNKVFLIYDVPSYFDLKTDALPKGLGIKTSYQYNGYLMDLAETSSTEDYIASRFSGKNRREFRSNIRRLEQCFSIRYEFMEKEISKDDFDLLFDQFYALLKRRYQDKGTTYHHLSSKKWDFYSELVFKMINEGMASLLVIRKGQQPIGITLNFHSEDILFETITVFDQDYYKFSIGKTSIIKLLDWCYENNTRISDFSKGAFDYKEKWANKEYDFHYHIYYDKRSLSAVLKSSLLYSWLEFKRFLREKEVNKIYRKVQYKLQGQKATREGFKIEKLETFEPSEDYHLIDLNDGNHDFLKIYAYTFLFANPQQEESLKLYSNKSGSEIILKGEEKSQKLVLNA